MGKVGTNESSGGATAVSRSAKPCRFAGPDGSSNTLSYDLFGCSLPVLLELMRLGQLDEKGNLIPLPNEAETSGVIKNVTDPITVARYRRW
jgi:hypothetical protein